MHKSLIPSGVEHENEVESIRAENEVHKSLIPSGVEHNKDGTLNMRKLEVHKSLIPSGVEHWSGAWMTGRIAGCTSL